MKGNTHLPPEKYLSDASLGIQLSSEATETAQGVLDDDSAKVTFFCDKDSDGDDDYGFEVTCEGKHVEIDGGYDNILEALGAFLDWVDRNTDDEDEDDDEG